MSYWVTPYWRSNFQDFQENLGLLSGNLSKHSMLSLEYKYIKYIKYDYMYEIIFNHAWIGDFFHNLVVNYNTL